LGTGAVPKGLLAAGIGLEVDHDPADVAALATRCSPSGAVPWSPTRRSKATSCRRPASATGPPGPDVTLSSEQIAANPDIWRQNAGACPLPSISRS